MIWRCASRKFFRPSQRAGLCFGLAALDAWRRGMRLAVIKRRQACILAKSLSVGCQGVPRVAGPDRLGFTKILTPDPRERLTQARA